MSPFGKVWKGELVRIIKHHSMIYEPDVLSFSIMGNHFHLLVAVHRGA